MYNDDERETKRRPPASERGRENKRRIQANIHITYERSKKCTRIEHKFTCTDTEREWECGREKQHTHSTAIYTTILLCRATISKFIQCKTFHFHACKYFFLYFCPLLCVECVYFFHFWISNGGIRIWMLFHLCNFLVMHVCVCVCVCNALFWYTFLHYVWLCELWATTWSLRHAMLWYVMRGSAAIEFWICSRLLLLPLMAVAGKPVYTVYTHSMC